LGSSSNSFPNSRSFSAIRWVPSHSATVDSLLCYENMGRRIVGAYVSLNCVAVLFEVIAASMTWHSTRFMVLGATIFRMKTGLLTASIDQGASLLCKFTPEKYCESLEDGFDLKEAAQQWCATAIVNVAAGPCQAFSTAFYLGLLVITTLLLNIIVLGVSCWLLYRYAAENKHKPVYRQTAIVMHLLATLAMVIVSILYSMVAGQQLDSIMGDMLPTGHGTGYGQIMFLVAILVQVAAAAMSNCVAMGNEQTEEEHLVDQMNKEKMRQYGGAKGFSTQAGPMDAERGYNQAFSNQQASFPLAQQASYAPAQSPQPLAPQPSYMAPQAVPGAPVMITAPASYTEPASYTGAAAW